MGGFFEGNVAPLRAEPDLGSAAGPGGGSAPAFGRPAELLHLDDVPVLVLDLPPRGTGVEREVGPTGQPHYDIPVGALDLHVGQGQVGLAQLHVTAAGRDLDVPAEPLDMNILRAGA